MMKNKMIREWAAHQQVEAQNNKITIVISQKALVLRGSFFVGSYPKTIQSCFYTNPKAKRHCERSMAIPYLQNGSA
jgi:hypothetical protein